MAGSIDLIGLLPSACLRLGMAVLREHVVIGQRHGSLLFFFFFFIIMVIRDGLAKPSSSLLESKLILKLRGTSHRQSCPSPALQRLSYRILWPKPRNRQPSTMHGPRKPLSCLVHFAATKDEAKWLTTDFRLRPSIDDGLNN